MIKPLPQIYTEELAMLRSNNTTLVSDNVARDILTFATVKLELYYYRQKSIRAIPKLELYHSRQKSIPAIPNYQDNVNIYKEPKHQPRMEIFFHEVKESYCIFLFGTDRNVNYLCKALKIFCHTCWMTDVHSHLWLTDSLVELLYYHSFHWHLVTFSYTILWLT